MRVAQTPPGETRRPLRSGREALVLVSLGWIAVVAAVYYRQVWTLFAGGPTAWTLPELGQSLRHTGLPFAGEALARGGAALGAAAVLVSALLGAGRFLDRWLTPAGLTRAESFAVRFANGACAWSLALLVLAAAGAYRPRPVALTLALAAAAAIVWSLRGLRPKDVSNAAGEVWRSGRGTRVWQLGAMAGGAIAFAGALAPEIEYDALYYHLHVPRRWLAAGVPVDDVTQYISLYPFGWELLFGGALALDGAPAAALLHWTALVAGAIVAGAIAVRALGVESRWIPAALYVTAPTVLWEGTTAYVDLALALHGAVGAGALWMSTRDADRRWLWLAGVNLGMACATKHLGLVIAAIAIGLYAARAVRQPATHAAVGARHASPVPTTRALLVVCALTLAIPSPWYVRAWAASGNPFFPDLYAVFGAQPPERWDDAAERALARYKARFGRERTPWNLATLPWDATMHASRYGGTLGPFPLLLAPAVILVVARRRAARWLAGGALLYTAVWASPISSFQMRFMVPWWLMAAPLAAAAVETLRGAPARPLLRWLTGGTLGALILLNLPPLTPLHEGDRSGWTGWLTHVVYRPPIEVIAGGISQDRYLREQVRSYGAWTYVNEHADPGARVLTFFGGDHFYSERARLWSNAVIARPVTWGATVGEDGGSAGRQEVLAGLQTLGITHLMAPPPRHQSAEERALVILQADTLRRAFEPIYEDYWVAVHRLRTGSEALASDQR